jgi:hypothetical protein
VLHLFDTDHVGPSPTTGENPPASMITRSNIAVIRDVGNNRMIRCHCLLSSSPPNVVMESLVHRHVLHLFPTGHVGPESTLLEFPVQSYGTDVEYFNKLGRREKNPRDILAGVKAIHD